MKRILITGITGFAGSYLAEHLVAIHSGELFGTYLSDSSRTLLSRISDKVTLEKIDLLHSEQVEMLISRVRPQEIYHLAALSSPAGSLQNPSDAMTNNITSQVNVFEGVRKANLTDCRIFITSSADIYGRVKPEDLPVDENTPMRPVNPYAVSKIAQDYLGLQYFLTNKLPIVRVRPFNHIGPRQSHHFVVPAFAKQIADIEKGKCEPIIKVGNLEAKKDFTDVRDMVRAYAVLMEKGEAGDVYNIGSGKSVQIKELLRILLSFSKKTIAVEEDQDRVRPNDTPDFYSDSSKMQQLTGWKPEIPIEKSLEDTLNYWREQD